MDKIKDEEERLWYAEKALENLWSRTILEHQIATNLYKPIGVAEYKYLQEIPDYLADNLPSIETLEKRLNNK